jgi:hypothetical protein
MVYFQTKNSNLGKIWRALNMENVVIFYDNLEYFWSFGIKCGRLV